MFYHAGIVESVNKSEAHPNLFMLQEQRRMHADISKFTNSFIYKNRVYDHQSVSERKELAKLQPFANEASVLFDTSLMGAFSLKDAASGSRFNIMSGLVAMQMMLIGLLDGVQSIGVVTPYRAQSRFLSTCIREMLQKTKYRHIPVLAATVHKFQGSERDMMILIQWIVTRKNALACYSLTIKSSPCQCSSDKGEREVHSIIRLSLYA